MLSSSFKDEAKRRELLRRLNEIEGVNFPDDVVNRYPSIPLKLLLNEVSLTRFLAAMNWFLAELRAT
jgi:hypothetical protein